MIETKVTWRGSVSLVWVEAALHEYGRAEILLPTDLHHALWRALGRGGHGMPELLDIAGGRELLQRVCEIDSLSELAQLSTLFGDAELDVRVLSPSRVIHVGVRSERADAAGRSEKHHADTDPDRLS